MANETTETYDNFESLKSRLDEIVEAVADETLPLDDALTLYEEAVALGLRATDLLEEDIAEVDSAELDEASATDEVAAPDAVAESEQATSPEPTSSDVTTSNEGQ